MSLFSFFCCCLKDNAVSDENRPLNAIPDPTRNRSYSPLPGRRTPEPGALTPEPGASPEPGAFDQGDLSLFKTPKNRGRETPNSQGSGYSLAATPNSSANTSRDSCLLTPDTPGIQIPKVSPLRR